jgi:hypothetical protein
MRDPLAISDQDRTKPTRQTYAAGACAVLDGRIAFKSPRVRVLVGRLSTPA